MESRDIQVVMAIQLACPEIAQWNETSYQRVADGEMAGWVSEDEHRVGGFVVARQLVRETEILNLAVRADVRRQGIGARLIEAAIAWSRELGAERVMLEVRSANENAIQFYQRRGFIVSGRRAKYYAQPVDDALVLTLNLAKD